MEEKRKVVVIGLDGATLDVIEPLVKRGKLPNLKRIMESGVSGKLQSTIHPITPQAWSSFLTGKNAGKHGIFDFTARKDGAYDVHFVNASMRRADTIFSILSGAGRKVGAICIPFTFPPEPVNGFMLSGLDSPAEDSRAVYPEELYEEIKKEFGQYYIHLASPVGRKVDEKSFWRDIQKEDENRAAISAYLMKKYPCDLFITVFNNTDRVQHQHLDEETFNAVQSGAAGIDENLLVRTYENSDAHIGALQVGAASAPNRAVGRGHLLGQANADLCASRFWQDDVAQRVDKQKGKEQGRYAQSKKYRNAGA